MATKEIIQVDEKLKHIAFIMDGNGRWAKSRNMPREYGHKNGARVFREITEYCHKIGIQYITVYAFSTENWKRPKKEVDAIMKLLDEYLDKQRPEKASIRFIGDISGLDPALQAKINAMQKETTGHDHVLNVAMNYGSRAELVNAFNKLQEEGKSVITEKDINSALYTGDCPDPDLIVRTGGDLRISNFLLWQAAYSELYFTDTLWPDMTPADVDLAVSNFYSRKRRFGGLDASSTSHK
ncbi:MAG: di-trans,poly-cis-decaprenylcistransferase [Ruminococcaceae bacterium]|nr:di-trans,poly-cis-decaprenylcistransferase [Oscillospiraceae bacterium]